MRSRSLVGLTAAAMLLTACSGLKDALTAHVDVVGRAGSQELSVTRLGDLLGNAKIPVPVNHESAAILADIWTGYQQIASASAHNDSLNDKQALDAALAPIFNMQKLQRYMDSVTKTLPHDTSGEVAYNRAAGGLIAARHILIGFKNQAVPPSQAEKDSLRKRAETVRAQVTSANFTEMAKKYSTDPTVAQNNGNLGVFPQGAMIQPFYAAAATLKPGEISQPVETNFGFHIIQRLTYADAKAEFDPQYQQAAGRIADSTFLAGIEKDANVQLKDNAVSQLKDAAKDPNQHRNDKSVVATFQGGSLTVGGLLDWIETAPPQQQLLQRIPQEADSSLKPFVRSVALQEVLLKRADAAKVDVPAPERAQMYGQVSQFVNNVWQTLGVDPKSLSDSAKTTSEKERLASARIDAYLDRMMAGQAQPVMLPGPLKKLLDTKYEASVNPAGVDRAFERAQKVRAAADSAKALTQPKSQIPLPAGPGVQGGQPGAGADPSAAQPQSTQPAKKTP